MLAEDISRIDSAIDMDEMNDLCRNGFTNSVEREQRVPFVQLGLWQRRAFHHSLVGVWLRKWTYPVTAFPESMSCIRFASM
jgi:hypothetical protein